MQDERPTGKKEKRPKRQRRERGKLHAIPDPTSGIFYLRGTIRGIEVRESTGTSDAARADEMRVKKEAELLNESVHGKKAVATFGDCVTNYLRQRDGGSNNRYLPTLNEYFGDMKVAEMTPKIIKDYANDRFPDCAGSTKNVSVINPIITVLRRAAFDRMCDLPAIEKFPEEHVPVTGAPPEWINEFLFRCDRPKVKAYVALITTTGCRGIDACRLRTERINCVEGTAYLPKTKNDDPRTLQLIEPVVKLLQSFEHDAKSGRVFGFSRTHIAGDAIMAVCARLGMPYYSGHRIGRHAFAERLLAEGYTLQQVMKMGGWRDVETLSKRYGHLEKSKVDEMVREEAAKVMRAGFKVVGGKDEE